MSSGTAHEGRDRRVLVAVTGPSGYLGARVIHALARRGTPVLPLSRADGFDLCEGATVAGAIAAAAPTALVHTAAANPGRPAASFDPTNRQGSTHVAAACAQAGTRLVHVSTDVVFDGRDAPYADGAPPCPLGAYGRSKAAAEVAVRLHCPTAAVVRTSLIYGLHEPDRSTAGFLARLSGGQELRLFADVVRQPVWVEALADALVALAVDLPEVEGVINVAGDQPIDRASFGRRLVHYWLGRNPLETADAAPAMTGAGPRRTGAGPRRTGAGPRRTGAGPRIVDVRAADLNAAGEGEPIPLDLRLRLGRARDLGLACPGVDAVLGRHGEPHGG